MSQILYYSTNLKAGNVSFRDALLKGLAPDGGLFMPGKVPHITPDEIASLSSKSYAEIAFEVVSRYLQDVVPDHETEGIGEQGLRF